MDLVRDALVASLYPPIEKKLLLLSVPGFAVSLLSVSQPRRKPPLVYACVVSFFFPPSNLSSYETPCLQVLTLEMIFPQSLSSLVESLRPPTPDDDRPQRLFTVKLVSDLGFWVFCCPVTGFSLSRKTSATHGSDAASGPVFFPLFVKGDPSWSKDFSPLVQNLRPRLLNRGS